MLAHHQPQLRDACAGLRHSGRLPDPGWRQNCRRREFHQRQGGVERDGSRDQAKCHRHGLSRRLEAFWNVGDRARAVAVFNGVVPRCRQVAVHVLCRPSCRSAAACSAIGRLTGHSPTPSSRVCQSMHGATKNANAAGEVFAVQCFVGIVAAVCVADEDDRRRNTRPTNIAASCPTVGMRRVAIQGTCGVFDQRDQHRVQLSWCRPTSRPSSKATPRSFSMPLIRSNRRVRAASARSSPPRRYSG